MRDYIALNEIVVRVYGQIYPTTVVLLDDVVCNLAVTLSMTTGAIYLQFT